MAENVRSAVADVTGMVRVMCRSWRTSLNIILLLSMLFIMSQIVHVVNIYK